MHINDQPVKTRWFLLALALALVVLGGAGCSSLAPAQFQDTAPRFDPAAYFTGHTHSHGVFENRAGEPARRFETDAVGHWEGGELTLNQTFTYQDGKVQHRRWRIRRLDAHRFEATASDVVGLARGEAYGNAFRWEYTVALKPGNPLITCISPNGCTWSPTAARWSTAQRSRNWGSNSRR